MKVAVKLHCQPAGVVGGIRGKNQCRTLCKYHTNVNQNSMQMTIKVKQIKRKNKMQKSKHSLYLSAPVPGPLNLRSNDVGTDSFQVSWDHSASDIVLYRLSWAPFTGGDTKEVSTNEILYIKVFVLETVFAVKCDNVTTL